MFLNPLLTTYFKGTKFGSWFCVFGKFQKGLLFPLDFSTLRFYLGQNRSRRDFQILVKGLVCGLECQNSQKKCAFHPTPTETWQQVTVTILPKIDIFFNSRATAHLSVKCLILLCCRSTLGKMAQSKASAQLQHTAKQYKVFKEN